MKSMDLNHGHNENGTGLLGFLLSAGGFFLMLASRVETSEIKSWIAFSLGAFASIISIIINWSKFSEKIKSFFSKIFDKKPKTNKNGK